MTAKLITFLVEFALIAIVWGAVGITYHWQTRGRWRRSLVGAHLMTVAGCFTWSAGLTVFNILAGDYAWRFPIQVVSYGAFIVLGIWRLTLMTLQRHREALARQSGAPDPAPRRPAP